MRAGKLFRQLRTHVLPMRLKCELDAHKVENLEQN